MPERSAWPALAEQLAEAFASVAVFLVVVARFLSGFLFFLSGLLVLLGGAWWLSRDGDGGGADRSAAAEAEAASPATQGCAMPWRCCCC